MISLTLLRNDQNGEHIQKSHTYFFFLLFFEIQISHIFTQSTQATN